MKAFLIDPVAVFTDGWLKEVDYNGDYREISKMLGCRLFDVARLNAEGDGIYVDDEGFSSGPIEGFIWVKGCEEPLAGKGLLLGCDEEGNSTAPSVDRDWILENIVVSDGCFVFDGQGQVVGLCPTQRM